MTLTAIIPSDNLNLKKKVDKLFKKARNALSFGRFFVYKLFYNSSRTRSVPIGRSRGEQKETIQHVCMNKENISAGYVCQRDTLQ